MIKKIWDVLKTCVVCMTLLAALIVLGLVGLAISWLFLPACIAVIAIFCVWAMFQD